MSWIVWISIICFVLLSLDVLLISLYAKMKRKRYIAQQENAAGGTKDEAKSQTRGSVAVSARQRAMSFFDGWIRYKLIRLGRIPCHAYRNFILRHIYHMRLAKRVVIYGGFEIRAPWNISIGEGTIIGDEAKLDGRQGIVVGKNVNLSTGVWIWTEQHNMDDPWFSTNDKIGPVRIDDRAWISCRAVILPKVHIGAGAVIAAGAVITKDCQEYGVYAGVPGKYLRTRNQELQYVFTGEHLPFY